MKKNKWKRTGGYLALMLMLGTAGVQDDKFPDLFLEVLAEEMTVAAEEEEGLLIEDFGEVEIDNSGAKLEELKEEERREAEEERRKAEEAAAAEAAAEAEARELAEAMAAEFRLEGADPVILQQHLEVLTEIESPIGSDGELICASYIAEVMEQYGFTISEQHFHEGFVNENGVDAPGLNIIAERGADTAPEKRTNDIFIVTTHYDSKTNPAEDDPFANDKTGAAVLLETARILSQVETDADICFVFFSGEEDGLYGSANFVDFMAEDYAHRVAGVIHVELVGYAPDYAYLLKTWDGQENEVGNLVKASELAGAMIEAEDGTTEEVMEEERWIWAEDSLTAQYNFIQKNMPAVTVSQDVFGEYAEQCKISEALEALDEQEKQAENLNAVSEGEITIDMDKLADITDILAASVYEVMSE